MAISSTSSSSNANGSAETTSTSGASNTSSAATGALINQLGPDAFLHLLTTQLANQNPLNPMDSTQSVAQLAQFSQLQSSQNLSKAFTTFQQNFGVYQAASMVGKSVAVNDTANGGTLNGIVKSVTIANGTPMLQMVGSDGNALNSAGYSVDQVLSISN